MKAIRKTIGAIVLLCVCNSAYAQYDYGNEVEDWSLDFEEEAEPKPQHKEYNNALYVQYGVCPSDYLTEGAPTLLFNEVSLGYFRSIQVVEETPFFVEAGLNGKFSYSDVNKLGTADKWKLLTLRLPVNVTYKLYLYKTRDIALAPFAGVNCRYLIGNMPSGWKRLQIGWQAGLKFCFDRMFVGASYSRDFPDDTKMPHIYEASAHIGVCF